MAAMWMLPACASERQPLALSTLSASSRIRMKKRPVSGVAFFWALASCRTMGDIFWCCGRWAINGSVSSTTYNKVKNRSLMGLLFCCWLQNYNNSCKRQSFCSKCFGTSVFYA
jgi:hypothetical protein